MYVAKHKPVIGIGVVVTKGYGITTRKPNGNPAGHHATSNVRAYLDPNNRRMLKTIGGRGSPSVSVSLCEGESRR